MRLNYFLIVLLWLICLNGYSQTNNQIDSIQLKIEQLDLTDSTAFFRLRDTVAYFAGRDLNKALKIALALEKRLQKSNNPLFTLRIGSQISQLYLLKGNVDSSKIHLEKGLADAIELKDTISLFAFYYLKGWLNNEQDIDGEAQTAYLKGLEIAEASKNYDQQISFLSGLSYSVDNLEGIKIRLGFLKRAKRIGEQHQLTKTNNYLNVLYNMAGIYQKNGRPDTAIIIYDELQKIYLEKNYTSGLASIANNVSHLYLDKKEYDKALSKAFEALTYDTITGTTMYIVGDMISIAKVYKGMNNVDSAIYYYHQADSISKATGMLNRRVEITKNIAELYAEEKRFEEAFLALQENIAATDTVNIIETKQKLHELENKYELEQKEIENKVLRINSDKDKKTIFLQLVILGLLIVVLIGIIFLLVANQKKRKQIQLLNSNLKESNLGLRQANQTKDKFFSVISHDLRGPIGNLKNLLGFFNEEDNIFSIDDAQKYMLLAEKELNNTYDLLENLLTWARSQFGNVNYNPQEIRICDFVRESLKPLVSVGESKHITILQNIRECDTIHADREMLAFIIRNLVSNAIKFTPDNGQITIMGHKKESHYSLSITDNGVGMLEEQQEMIFNLSENRSTKGTNNEPGTGLGLILCKEFADKNNINLEVKSQLNKGTTFTLKFKL